LKQIGNGLNRELLSAAIRYNAIILGIVGGTIAAIGIFVATHISLAKWGESAGTYLNLLGVFLPGYDASSSGAWIGAFWTFIFCGLAGFLTYWLYGRLLGDNLADTEKEDQETDPIFKPAILKLYGVPFGVSIGAAVAGALFFSTLWLVVRGTAGQSYHAALLSNYLPGYSPSILGGFIGAMELFVTTFVSCLLFTTVYNKVVEIRHGKS